MLKEAPHPSKHTKLISKLVSKLGGKFKYSEKLLLLLMVPALILFALFMLGPSIWGIYISFTNEALIGPQARNPRFVGLQNYVRAIHDSDFHYSVYASTIFVFGSAIVGQCLLGLLLAILTRERRGIYNKIKWIAAIASTVCFLAWITPEMVLSLDWLALLDYDYGLLNDIIEFFIGRRINWFYYHPMLSIILINIWWGTGWSMLLFKSALESVPPEIEEAAEIDGCSGWQKYVYVILPLLKGAICINLILITIWTYGVTGFILALMGYRRETSVMTVYAYQKAFKFYEIGYGSTISIFIFMICLILSIIYYKLLKVRV